MKSIIKYSVLSALLILISCIKQGEQFATSSDGVKISFNRQGSAEPAIILLHGWSNNKTIWNEQMSHFSEKYTVISVDLPGFGKSGSNRKNWTMNAYAQDVISVINKLDLQKVVLVGFSMGGTVAIEAAHLFPKQIDGVILVDALENVEAKFPPPVISYMDSLFMDLVSNPTKEKLLGGRFYKKNQEESFDRVYNMLKDVSMLGWRESLLEALHWQNEYCINRVKNLSVPVKAIYSTRGPVDIAAFKKYNSSFDANIVEDTGHLVMWDAPKEFNRLLEENVQLFINK